MNSDHKLEISIRSNVSRDFWRLFGGHHGLKNSLRPHLKRVTSKTCDFSGSVHWAKTVQFWSNVGASLPTPNSEFQSSLWPFISLLAAIPSIRGSLSVLQSVFFPSFLPYLPSDQILNLHLVRPSLSQTILLLYCRPGYTSTMKKSSSLRSLLRDTYLEYYMDQWIKHNWDISCYCTDLCKFKINRLLAKCGGGQTELRGGIQFDFTL